MNKTTLQEQLAALMASKAWIAPPYVSYPGTVNVGTMSDWMKSCYTLLQQKKQQYHEKFEALMALKHEHGIADIQDMYIAAMTQSNIFGGSAMDSEFGGGHFLMVTSHPRRKKSTFDVLTTPYQEINLLTAECNHIFKEMEALEAMFNADVSAMLSAADIQRGTVAFAEDFSVTVCGCDERAKTTLKESIAEKMDGMQQDFHFITLSKQSELYSQFSDLMKEMNAKRVSCSGGEVRHFASETEAILFFPKDINAPEMYHDEELDAQMDGAAERKERAAKLFESIIAVGSVFELKNAEAHV